MRLVPSQPEEMTCASEKEKGSRLQKAGSREVSERLACVAGPHCGWTWHDRFHVKGRATPSFCRHFHTHMNSGEIVSLPEAVIEIV